MAPPPMDKIHAVEYNEVLYFVEFLIKRNRCISKKQHKIDKLNFMSIKKTFDIYCFILLEK